MVVWFVFDATELEQGPWHLCRRACPSLRSWHQAQHNRALIAFGTGKRSCPSNSNTAWYHPKQKLVLQVHASCPAPSWLGCQAERGLWKGLSCLDSAEDNPHRLKLHLLKLLITVGWHGPPKPPGPAGTLTWPDSVRACVLLGEDFLCESSRRSTSDSVCCCSKD